MEVNHPSTSTETAEPAYISQSTEASPTMRDSTLLSSERSASRMLTTTLTSVPLSLPTTSNLPVSSNESPRKKILRQKIKKLVAKDLYKSKLIRKLQNNNWALKHRIFRLTDVIKELHEKNLINEDHVSSIIKEFGENEDIINRLFLKTKGKKVSRSYSEKIRKFAITCHVREKFHNCLPHVKTVNLVYTSRC